MWTRTWAAVEPWGSTGLSRRGAIAPPVAVESAAMEEVLTMAAVGELFPSEISPE